jgi:ribosome-associated toxin RatA of RatAB toxin-antitoxin module
MEESILKAVINKSDWLIITIFIVYLAFKLLTKRMDNKKAKTREKQLDIQYEDIKNSINTISQLAENSKIKDSLIESIERKLKIIYNQYGSELSKEAAISVIQNIYFNYASSIANEIYELQKKNFSNKKIIAHISNAISIINDEKMQELDAFMYRDRHLITYTTGQIVDPAKIVECINSYSDKNGMLRKELEDLLSIESGIVIKRL